MLGRQSLLDGSQDVLANSDIVPRRSNLQLPPDFRIDLNGQPGFTRTLGHVGISCQRVLSPQL
jgi:hypothetical protein